LNEACIDRSQGKEFLFIESLYFAANVNFLSPWTQKMLVQSLVQNWIFKSYWSLQNTISIPVVDFTKSCKSKISRKCEFQPIKSLEITLTMKSTPGSYDFLFYFCLCSIF